MLVDGEPVVIVGIVPDASGFPVHRGAVAADGQLHGASPRAGTSRSLRVIGRVAPDADVTAVRARNRSGDLALVSAHPDTNAGIRARVVSINERSLGRASDPAWLAFMAVGCLVALIACANVANLLLGRGLAA